MTLQQTPYELGFLIILVFLFQVFNTTDSLKATREIHSFLGLNKNFTELKNGDKRLFWLVFLESIVPQILLSMGVRR